MNSIAIVGATGVVGRTVVKILEEKKLYDNFFDFYASKKSAGKKIKFANKNVFIKELTSEIFDKNYTYALFCTAEEISKKYVRKLASTGTIVIDFSSYYRKKYPLVVPEINPEDIKGNIICNPNCSTIAGVMSLYKIQQTYGLKRVIYSTYQAVSGAGKKALDDLKVTDAKKLKKMDFLINNNLIPCIGEIKSNLYTKEENKMIYETKKILHQKNLIVSATCVRVPIDVCHSESISFETKKRTNIDKLKNAIKCSSGVKSIDEPCYPMPIDVKGQNDVYVGRIRKDFSKNWFSMFIVSDNLRKGAAQNGVQILEYLLRSKNAV